MTATNSNQPFNDEDNRFLERTLNGNFRINLNKQNIIDIALIKYGYGVNQDLIFKVYDEIKNLLLGLDEYINDYNDNGANIPLVAIFYNSNHWSTLMVCKTKNAAYYTDHYKTVIPDVLEAQLKFDGINIHDLELLNDINYKYYESGILALDTAVALYNNKEQILLDNTEQLFNDISACNPGDMIEKRISLTSCLQIMQIQKIKLNTLSNNLTKALKQMNLDKTVDFNYSNANIFLYFLETFALQDLHMNDIEPEYKKYLENIINKEDVDRVACIRSKLLLHRKNIQNKPSIIKPNNLKLIININVSQNVIDFFQHISNYVNYILSILQGTYVCNKQIIRPNQFLVEDILNVGDDVEQDEYNKEIDNHLEKFFSKAFSLPSYSNDKQTHDEEKQCIFDLIVNFAPYFDKAFNKRKEVLKEMRNIQIHEFYRFSDERFAIEYALTNFLRENKNSLFKCCYSRYVYPLLQDFNKTLKEKKNNKNNIGKIKEKLCNSLVTFSDIHRAKISRQQKVQNQNAYVDAHNQDQQSTIDAFYNVRQDNTINKIKESVEDYFKLLLFIANEDTKDVADIDSEYITKRYKNLKVEQVLKIKTDLRDLKRFKISTQPGFENDYETIKKSLQQEFEIDYGIMEQDFNTIVMLTIHWDDVEVDDEVGHINSICSHIEIISEQQNTYKCSVKDIIKMYGDRRELKFRKGSLQEKINSLPLTKICEAHVLFKSCIPQRKITRQYNPDRFVAIIYEIIYNESQKPISNDLKDVFNDCEFLDYLSKQDISFPNLMKESLDFMIPLYARIINLSFSTISIKDSQLWNVIKKLVDEDNIIHLKPIMHTVRSYKNKKDPKKKKIFLNKICDFILEKYKENYNIYFLNNILDDADIADDIIGVFSKKDNIIVIKILKTLVDKSYMMAFHDDTKALELLTKKNMHDAVDKLKKDNLTDELYLYWNIKYSVAHLNYKIENRKVCYQIVEDLTLNTKTTDEVKPYYFLSLSYMAFIQNEEKEYQNAYETYGKLYTEFVKYVLGAVPTEFNLNTYNAIINHDKYKYALTIDNAVRYLEVLRIKSDIAYSKCRMVVNTKENKKDALLIYEEIHNIQSVVIGRSQKQIIIKRYIAAVSLSLSIIMTKECNIIEAMYYGEKALMYNKEVFELQKQIYWPSHPAVTKSFDNVLKTYSNLFKIRSNTTLYDEYIFFININKASIPSGFSVTEIEHKYL